MSPAASGDSRRVDLLDHLPGSGSRAQPEGGRPAADRVRREHDGRQAAEFRAGPEVPGRAAAGERGAPARGRAAARGVQEGERRHHAGRGGRLLHASAERDGRQQQGAHGALDRSVPARRVDASAARGCFDGRARGRAHRRPLRRWAPGVFRRHRRPAAGGAPEARRPADSIHGEAPGRRGTARGDRRTRGAACARARCAAARRSAGRGRDRGQRGSGVPEHPARPQRGQRRGGLAARRDRRSTSRRSPSCGGWCRPCPRSRPSSRA